MAPCSGPFDRGFEFPTNSIDVSPTTHPGIRTTGPTEMRLSNASSQRSATAETDPPSERAQTTVAIYRTTPPH